MSPPIVVFVTFAADTVNSPSWIEYTMLYSPMAYKKRLFQTASRTNSDTDRDASASFSFRAM